MQTPTGSTGEIIGTAEWNMWTSVAQDLASWWADLLAQQNAVIPGGGTLAAQAGTPIVITYAGHTAYVNGPGRMARFVVPSGSVTLAAADPSFGRYDLIVGTASQTTPNDSAGNPTLLDVLTVTRVTGTPGSSPVVPALPANSVQLGYVLVPAGATSATQCTITQSLGPLAPKNLQDLTNHLAASMASAVVHGFQATAAGGTGANQLAQTDAHGNVGGAAALWDGNTLRSLHPWNDGSHVAGEIPQYNASGRVEDSERLGGLGPASYDSAGAAAAVQTSLNSHTGASLATSTVHGLMVEHGNVTQTGLGTTASGTVTFANAFPSVPDVLNTIYQASGGQNVQVTARRTTGFDWSINAGSNINTLVFGWLAIV